MELQQLHVLKAIKVKIGMFDQVAILIFLVQLHSELWVARGESLKCDLLSLMEDQGIAYFAALPYLHAKRERRPSRTD